MCRASSDDDDDDDDDVDDEFNFDNLFVSHLDDILGYTVRRTKGSVTVTLTDRKRANRTRGHAAPRYGRNERNLIVLSSQTFLQSDLRDNEEIYIYICAIDMVKTKKKNCSQVDFFSFNYINPNSF